MQITAEHLIAELKDQWFARWVAEKQVQLLTAENAQLKQRVAELEATTNDIAGADDAGDSHPSVE